MLLRILSGNLAVFNDLYKAIFDIMEMSKEGKKLRATEAPRRRAIFYQGLGYNKVSKTSSS